MVKCATFGQIFLPSSSRWWEKYLVKRSQTYLFMTWWTYCIMNTEQTSKNIFTYINWIFSWRLPIQNHLNPPIAEKRQTWNSIRINILKITSMPNPVKSFGYVKCYIQLESPKPIKSTRYTIRYNYQKICSWLRIPKTILVIKKGHISLGKFFKYFTNDRKKTISAKAFSCRPFLNIHAGTIDETFKQSRRQDPFSHLLKSSAGTYGSSGSQFFRTTIGLQSGPGTFDKWRFDRTFSTILGVTEIYMV